MDQLSGKMVGNCHKKNLKRVEKGSSDDSGSTQEEERDGEGRFNSFTLNTVYLIEQTAIHEDAIKH